MATQTSQLVQNLQSIYTVKQQIKAAIPTNSDLFEDYPSYISALHPSGTSYITSNGSHDVSSYATAYVNVEGGGSGDFDGYDYWNNNAYSLQDIVDNSSLLNTELNYYNSCISSDFTFEEVDGGQVSYFTWHDMMEVEVGENDYSTYTCYVTVYDDDGRGNFEAITQAFENYSSELENMIFPVLQNVTVSESSNPTEDGYDYLIEGKLYSMNLMDASGPVMEITENGFYPNNTENCYFGFNVNVSGSNPLYGSVQVLDMIKNGETTANYVQSMIYENFEYTEENDKYTISWDDKAQFVEKEQLIQKIIHVVLTGDPHGIYGIGSDIASAIEDYPSLYTNICPVLENATVTESSDPSKDGYDYLLEGDLYAWNLTDNCGTVDEIIGNGFHANKGGLGVNVNIEPTGKQVDNNLCAYLFAPDYNNLDISGEQYVPKYYTSFSFFDQEVDTTTNHDDVITAEVTYYEGPEGEPDKLPNCSYVQNLNVNWFNDVNNMGEGWFKLSFNYTGSESIYIMFHLLKASYKTGGTDKWNMPSGYRFDSWWEDGVNFIDNDDSPNVFQIPGAGYYYFYICAGTFDGTSGTYSRSFRPPFENTSQFITPREFFGE